MSAVILGVGNILLSDEGVGVRVVEQIEARYRLDEDVTVIDGGTCGMDLMDELAERDLVIVVDAVRTGEPPGTLVTLTGEAVPALFRERISPHQLGVSDLLAALTLLGRSPRQLALVGVVPESMATGLALSERVAACLEPLVETTLAVLREHGWQAWPQPADSAPADGTAAGPVTAAG